RSVTQKSNSLKKKSRWSIVRDRPQAALELGLRLVPILPTICGKAIGKQFTQLVSLGLQPPSASHQLVNANRLRLACDCDKVELPRFDRSLRQPIGLLTDDNQR